jgi:hypothetical protein
MVGQQPERVRVEPVVGPVAVAVGADQPGRPQRLEVVAHQWLADAQLVGEMGHAQLLAGEELDDPPSQRICQPPRNLQGRAGGTSVGERGCSHLDQD